MPIRDAIVIGAVLTCTMIALGRPKFGVLAYILFSTLTPQSMTWGLATRLPAAKLLAIGTLIGSLYLFSQGGLKIPPLTRVAKLLLCLWILFGVTSFFALHPDRAGGDMLEISKILLMLFLLTFLIDDRKWIHYYLMAIALPIGFYAFKGGLFTVITGGEYTVWGPEFSYLEANNSIGLGMAVNLPILAYLGKNATGRFMRWTLWSMALFTVPAVIATFSRGAWLALAAAVGLLALKSRHKVLFTVLLVVVVLVVLPFASGRMIERYAELKQLDQEGAAQSRLTSWASATQVALANPLFGCGFSYYSIEAYQRYYPEFLIRYPGKVWSAHSIWFAILGEHGFVGLLLWSALILACFASLSEVRAFVRKHPENEWLADYVNLLQVSLLTYLIAGTFLDAAYFELFYYLVGLVILLVTWTRNQILGTDPKGRGAVVATPRHHHGRV